MTILYTAKKYAVTSLENLCVDYLLKNLCPDNAFTLLTQVRKLILIFFTHLFFNPFFKFGMVWTVDRPQSHSYDQFAKCSYAGR